MEHKRVAVITARGGSKRIPKKNIKEFCGKPILVYSIEAALQSQLFDEVMVSTDSQEIADVAIKYGANVPFMRSETTSNDFATIHDVLIEVFTEYEKRGQKFDEVVCIYPTAPFVTARKLKEAVCILEKEKADILTPVVRFSFPPQRALLIENGLLEYQYPECASMRSQDLEPIYHDCGQFFLMKVENVFCDMPDEKWVPLVVSELEVQDIDTEEDWAMAEIKYRIMKEREVAQEDK